MSPTPIHLCAFWFSLALACLVPTLADGQARPVDSTEAATADEASEADATPAPSLPQAWADAIDWRSVGPANMSGRIPALTVYEADPSIWWAASASGGLLKTTNNGVSFTHQFDDEATVSIGDVKVAQSDPSIVWVGTGEPNPRNSVSWGNGVYKSTDGGETWTHMGLDETFQIGRMAIHPTNPDVVYVGALGRLWGPNDARGVFKTTDGGETWEKVFFLDDKTGIIELQMNPRNPDTLLVAAYERMRGALDDDDPEVKFGEATGIYRTTDGGENWERMTTGLPTVRMGRIGLDYFRGNPQVVYAVIESEKIGKEPENAPFVGILGEDADVGSRITRVVEEGPAAEAGLEVGDIVVSVDGDIIHSYADLLAAVRRHVAGETTVLTVSRDRETVEITITLAERPAPPDGDGTEGGGQFPGRNRNSRNPFSAFLGGQQPNLQGQQGESETDHGGVYRSDDGGGSWLRVNTLNPRPMYFSQIRVDPTDENNVYVLGVSLYKSNDGGQHFTSDGADRSVHVDHHALWIDPRDSRHMILGNDGGVYVTYDQMQNWTHHNQFAIGQFYHVTVGPRRDYWVYGGLQDNGSWGGPSRSASNRGVANWDWLSIGGGDGFICRVDANDPDLVYFESQNGGMGRRHFKTGERARIRPRAPRGTRYRWNWRTPFILSSHNSKVFYVGANHVFRSLDRGNGLRRISPEISATDEGSATAIAESPRDSDLLYVGTDDGALWVTRDGGNEWTALYFPTPLRPEDVVRRTEIFYNLLSTAPAPAAVDDEESDDPPAPPIPPRRQQMLDRIKAMDTNGDGKISREEAPEGFAERLFGRIDANEDGVIDDAELQTFATRPRGERGGRGEGRPGGAAAGGNAASPEATSATEGAPPRGRRGRRGGGSDDPARTDPPVSTSNLGDFLDGPRYVSEIVASRFEAGRVYLALDAHRSNDDLPYLFASEDFGTTWRSLTENLPASAGSTRTIEEDLTDPNILYIGTEFGAWVSIDRGETWTEFGDLPTVAVHALAQSPVAGEIVAGTHGRSLWIADVTALRQMNKETPSLASKLFRPNDAIVWRGQPRTGTARGFIGENPPAGARIHYSIGAERVGVVEIRIENLAGETLATIEGETARGLHEAVWNLRRDPRRGQGNRGRRFGPRVAAGEYRVVLDVDGAVSTQPLKVELDPNYSDATWSAFEHLEEEFFRSEEDGGDEETEEESEEAEAKSRQPAVKKGVAV